MDKNDLRFLLSQLPNPAILRGKEYAQQQRVHIISSDNSTIYAIVQGSHSTPYKVSITRKESYVFGLCTCPVSSWCKHVAATIVTCLSEKNTPEDPNTLSSIELDWVASATKQTKPLDDSLPASGLFFVFIPISSYNAHDKMQIHLQAAKKKKGGALSRAQGKTHPLQSLLQGALPYSITKACTKEDWALLQALWFESNTNKTSISLVKKIVETERAVLSSVSSPSLRWGKSLKGSFTWVLQDERQGLALASDKEENLHFLLSDGIFYIDPTTHTCGNLIVKEPLETVEHLLSSPLVNPHKVAILQKKLKEALPSISIRKQKIISLKSQKCIPCLSLHESFRDKESIRIEGTLAFYYAEHLLPPASHPTTTIQKKETVYCIERDLTIEKTAAEYLRNKNWYEYGDSFAKQFSTQKLDPLRELVAELKKNGWILKIPNTLPIQECIEASDDWYVEMNEAKNHWFDLEIGQLVNGKRVNLIPYLREFLSMFPDNSPDFSQFKEETLDKEQAVTLKTGETLLITFRKLKAIIEPFLGLLNASTSDTSFEISDWQVGALSQLQESLPNTRLEWQAPERYTKMAQQLQDTTKVEIVEPPKTLLAELRSYQILGLSWLQFLRQFHLAGILADDMGLGKTIQTLAHILIEKEAKRLTNPVLIVAPTTLMNNWATEATKFAPSLNLLILQGQDRKKHFNELQTADILLTTYPLLSRDKETLLSLEYHTVILDEAQNIKNAKTQAHSVLRELKSTYRLCLSGTPIENNLGELWSFFSILLPGFLGDEKQFNKIFRKPIEKEGSLERKKLLQKRISPFVLRRTKQDVLQELPPKTELINRIPLTEKQQELYEAVRLTMMNKVMAEVEKKGLARSHIVLLDALLKLRQICCDPRLLKTNKNGLIEDSAKLLYLRETLPIMIEKKQKILIFSQFTSMLKLIEEELNHLSVPFVTITGSTQDRKTPVDQFQNGTIPVFLISLKAGGTGLNLTAADTVIHYDPWWNPAVENQATDRAHRLGQEKPVFVHKWIADKSVEEKILQLQAKKKALADSLFDSSNADSLALDIEDLKNLFAPLS